MKKLFFVLPLFYFSLAFTQQPTKIKQVDSDKQIELWHNKTSDLVGLNIWLEYELCNNLSEVLFISDVDFYITNEFGPVGRSGSWISIYKEIELDGIFVQVPLSKNELRTRLSNPSRYRVRPVFRIYNTSEIYDSLRPYINDMKIRNVDSMHIGTLEEFKGRHSYVVEKLMQNDSITFTVRHLEERKNTYITLPVEY